MKEVEQNIDPIKKPIIKDDEIDLIEVAKTIWAGRMLIIKVTFIFGILGLLIAFTARVEYSSSSKLISESEEDGNAMGNLGSLAGLAGINLNMSSGGSLTPELYPEIVYSTPFLMELMAQPLYFETLDTTLSSFEYFKNIMKPTLLGLIREYTIGLPGKLKDLIISSDEIESSSNNDMIRLSKEDWEIIEAFKDRIAVSVDDKTGIVSVECEMPDPVATAHLTKLLIGLLTEDITTYKIEKAKINLDFIQERFDEAKDVYEEKQETLALFVDQNLNVSTASAKIKMESLQNELNVAFEVHKGLASQLEQAKIQVKEETPVFTVLEPVSVPFEKSAPKGKIIIIVWFFLGGVISTALIFGREYLTEVKERW